MAALSHFLRQATPRLRFPGRLLESIVDRITHCISATASSAGNSGGTDSVHAAALCARAFRRGFTAIAGEAQQLQFLKLAFARLKSPGAASGGSPHSPRSLSSPKSGGGTCVRGRVWREMNE